MWVWQELGGEVLVAVDLTCFTLLGGDVTCSSPVLEKTGQKPEMYLLLEALQKLGLL